MSIYNALNATCFTSNFFEEQKHFYIKMVQLIHHLCKNKVFIFKSYLKMRLVCRQEVCMVWLIEIKYFSIFIQPLKCHLQNLTIWNCKRFIQHQVPNQQSPLGSFQSLQSFFLLVEYIRTGMGKPQMSAFIWTVESIPLMKIGRIKKSQ